MKGAGEGGTHFGEKWLIAPLNQKGKSAQDHKKGNEVNELYNN